MSYRTLGPLDPIFDEETQTGSIQVGGTPGSTPPPCTGIFTILGSVQDAIFLNQPDSMVQYGSDRLFVTSQGPAGDAIKRIVSVDVSDPTSPEIVDWFSGFNLQLSIGIAVDGDYAYVGTQSHLTVVNVSDPQLVPVAGVTPGVVNRGVIKDGDYVYVGSQASATFSVVDVSDPLIPVIVGSITSPTINNIWGLAKQGNYVFAGCSGSSRFVVIDVSNPASPTIAASITTGVNNATGVVVDGSYAYVLMNTGLRVVDISTPTSPVIVGSVDASPSGAGHHLVKDGNYVYSTFFTQTVFVFDVSTPTAPTQVGSLNPDATALTGIAKSGDYLYVTLQSIDRIRVIDVSTPSSPTSVGSIADSVYLDQVQGVYPVGSTLYASGDGVFTALDVSTPTTPAIDWTTYGYLLAYSGRIGIRDDHLVIPSQTTPGTLTMVDVTDPDNPTVTGFVRHADLISDSVVLVHGDYAYVGSASQDRITIVDVSNPAAPNVLGTITDALLNNVVFFDVAGDYLYAAAALSDALVVVDISVPSSPVIVGSVSDSTTLDLAFDAAVSGDHVYVACGGGRLTVVDVSTPTAPIVVGTVASATLNGAIDVTVDGTTCFVACQTSDAVVAVDVSDPTDPTIVNAITDATLLNAARRVMKDGDNLYVLAFNDDRVLVVEYVCP